MQKKARLGIYLRDEKMARQIKVAAAKRRTSVSRYCGQAIEDRLMRDGEAKANDGKGSKAVLEALAFLKEVDRLRKQIGPIGIESSELVKAGRRR